MFRPIHTLKTACYHWFDDSASQMGAALAYSSLFSLAPVLIIAIAVAGLVYGEASAREQVVRRLADFIGPVSADVVKTMLYRPRVFGLPFTRVLHPVMRGPSPWTVGERELFAAYTSRLNQCPF